MLDYFIDCIFKIDGWVLHYKDMCGFWNKYGTMEKSQKFNTNGKHDEKI